VLFNVVVVRWSNTSVLILERQGGCTCRHSDAQVSRGQKWGFKDKRDSNFGPARSPLYIEVGVCRAVVRHTCAWWLGIHGKCNRRGVIRENVERETLQFV